MTDEKPALIRIKEVSNILSMSESSVRRKWKKKKIPAPVFQDEGCVLWSRSEILDLTKSKVRS